MDKKLTHENLQTVGSSTKHEQKSANSLLIFLMAAILILLIFGQFFLPITTIKHDGKEKKLTLTDFALSKDIDMNDFTSDKMFFLTESITMEKFLNKSNTTLENFFNDSKANLMINAMNYDFIKNQSDYVLYKINLNIPMSEFIFANNLTQEDLIKNGILTKLAEKTTVEDFINANNITLEKYLSETSMEKYLNTNDITLASFFSSNGIDESDLRTNIANYASSNGYELSSFSLDVPMSEFIIANNLTEEIPIKDDGQSTKTVLKINLTTEQLKLLTKNYFESGFIHNDGLIVFITIFSVLCCIASLVLIVLAFSKITTDAGKAYKFTSLSFIPILAAKGLAFFTDIIVKGEFSGVYGKYTSWTRFVKELSPSDEVHISTVPIHITPVLAISIIIPLVISIGILIKNHCREK